MVSVDTRFSWHYTFKTGEQSGRAALIFCETWQSPEQIRKVAKKFQRREAGIPFWKLPATRLQYHLIMLIAAVPVHVILKRISKYFILNSHLKGQSREKVFVIMIWEDSFGQN
jgi:hypothetical protein